MLIKVQTKIKGTKDKIWKVITDIENSPNVINGIEKTSMNGFVEMCEEADNVIFS